MHHAVTLEALRVMQAIHQKGSFASAAQALFKVPSAITYTIAKLESELNVTLFDRSGQRAVLTPAGQLVLEEGRNLLNAAEQLEHKVKQLDSGWEPRLSVAVDTIVPLDVVLGHVDEFCKLDKQVEISVLDEALGGGWDALYTQRAELAIGVTGELPSGLFNVVELGKVEFVFALAPDHPLASKGTSLNAEQIAEYPAVVVADSSRALPERQSGLLPSRQRIRVSSMAAKINAQRLGVGVGFVPKHFAMPLIEDGQLICMQTDIPRPPVSVYMAAEKSQKGKALQWFWQAMQATEWLNT